MAEEIEKIKISELPEEGTTLEGFYTIGTKQEGGVLKSKKVNLGFVQTAANNANSAASDAETKMAQFTQAEDARVAAEQERVISENARATAETARSTAEQGRMNAEATREEAENARNVAEQQRETATEVMKTATADANSATEAANTAAGRANEAADKFNAAIVQETGNAQDKVISQHGVTEAINGITDALTDYAHKGEVRHIERDLGMYPELEPVPLNSEVTGKYINSEGKYVDASGWNVASIGAVSLGNTYLLNMVSSANMVLGVALFVSRVYKRDKEGKIIGTILTPLFSAKNTSIPASGYVLFEAMDDYEEVLICYKPELTTQMLVARWGFKASHATQLRNLRLIVDNKTDFEGIYELLTAGYALNLVGKGNGEPQAFMSRKTGGGNITDGSAVIKEVDGVQPIVWNQLIQPISDLSVKTTGGLSVIKQNNILHCESGASSNNALLISLKLELTHIWLDVISVKSNRDFFIQNHIGAYAIKVTKNEFIEYAYIGKMPSAAYSSHYVYNYTTLTQGEWVFEIKYVNSIDLTQMFGAGNEPSTYEEYLDRISHYHIKDAYAYNAGEVVNYKGVGIKTTNVDGTKTYVRDWSEVMRKYFPDGMTSLNGVKDFFNDKKAVRKWGCKVFDGTEAWAMDGIHFYVQIKENMANKGYNTSLKCAMYTQASDATEYTNDKIISAVAAYYGKNIIINDSAFTSVNAWKSHLTELYAAGNPLVVYYELAEPVEDIFEKPLNLTYTVINGGTETSLATENSTRFEGSIAYNKDYVAVVDELQMQNRVTTIELENWEN